MRAKKNVLAFKDVFAMMVMCADQVRGKLGFDMQAIWKNAEPGRRATFDIASA